MSTLKRLNLVAPCGIDCGNCELYLCKNDQELFDELVSKGVPESNLPCEGCRVNKGACPIMSETCETYSCISTNNLDFCTDCLKFPCVKLHPCSDRADVLPHNMKIYNLCQIERDGLERFVDISDNNIKRYYIGKMIVGKGPKI